MFIFHPFVKVKRSFAGRNFPSSTISCNAP